MDTQTLIYIFVGVSFALYIAIAIWSRAGSTSEFYVAGGGVNPVVNGMATAADWMSAASFISMAGLIAFLGYDGSVYLMGWTGGYVLLALLLAPYLRKFGEFTVPDFIGTRYYSKTARVVAVVCLIFISFTYIAGQMRGVGIVFSRFLDVPILWGVVIGMGIVFIYAVLGGMKGITYTQVAQYCVLIFAYLVPAFFISFLITGNPIPALGLGSEVNDGSGLFVLQKLDLVLTDLGFAAYTDGSKSTIDIFCITMALMVGTAGLPHVIVRFFTVPKASDARKSAGWALLFIALLYVTAGPVGAFARLNFIDTVNEQSYSDAPEWFTNWEANDLIAWRDKNADGRMQYRPGEAFEGAPVFSESGQGASGERVLENAATDNANEVYVDRDIMVLANPEIAQLARLGDRAGRGGRTCGGAIDSGRLVAGDILQRQPRFAEENLPTRYYREGRVAGRAHRGDGGHRGGGISWHLPARLGGAGGGVCLWPCRRQPVPGDIHGHFLHAHEPRGRDCGHGERACLHLSLHRLVQAMGACGQCGGELAAGHLARGYRRGRHGHQLCRRHCRGGSYQGTARRYSQSGREYPRAAWGRKAPHALGITGSGAPRSVVPPVKGPPASRYRPARRSHSRQSCAGCAA